MSGVDTPGYVAEALASFETVRFKRISHARYARTTSAPAVICVVKDEMDRLPDFLRHYREGGTESFYFVDNGSTDGGVDYLTQQPDVDLVQTLDPFKWPQKQGWINLAAAMSGRDARKWFIYADADEHVIFDGFGRQTFAHLAEEMERKGIRRVRGMLLDMYADGPLLRSSFKGGEPLINTYPYFDGDGYVEAKYKEIISRKGGPRQRVFSRADSKFRPEMTKYPLFQLHNHDIFANPHHIWPYEGNFDSPCYLGILHFKFLPNVLLRIERAIADRSYWDNSLEYRCYDAVLREDPELSLMYEGSRRYKDPTDLLCHIQKLS